MADKNNLDEKTGESRETTGILGDQKTEHTDAEGEKTGESRETTGILGDEKTEHFDTEGNKTGETRETTGILGDEKEEHTNVEGEKTGESRDTTGILGDERRKNIPTWKVKRLAKAERPPASLVMRKLSTTAVAIRGLRITTAPMKAKIRATPVETKVTVRVTRIVIVRTATAAERIASQIATVVMGERAATTIVTNESGGSELPQGNTHAIVSPSNVLY